MSGCRDGWLQCDHAAGLCQLRYRLETTTTKRDPSNAVMSGAAWTSWGCFADSHQRIDDYVEVSCWYHTDIIS